MKTVRLSRQLRWDITKAAEKKFDNANPSKAEPEDGYAALLRLGIMDKTNKMKESFKTIWGYDMPMRTVNYVKLTCEYTNEEGNLLAISLKAMNSPAGPSPTNDDIP